MSKSRKKRAQRNRAHPSALERHVHSMLRASGVEFVTHPSVETIVGGKWRRLEPDILIPAEHRVIEVNGCFVHGCKECTGDRGRDRLLRYQVKVRALERAGYTVETVWEHEITGRSTHMELAAA